MRVPLYAKLMCSYLLVVGLVFVPTYIYLRTVQVGELKDTLEQDMREELELLGDRLAEADPAEVESVAEQLVDLRRVGLRQSITQELRSPSRMSCSRVSLSSPTCTVRR